MKHKTHTRTGQHKAHLILVTVAMLASAVIIFELSPIGGNIRFYTAWFQCGQKPLATAGAGNSDSGAKYYFEPTSFPGAHNSMEYFCTPLEAEVAGYSANPDRYEFPQINAQ